MSLPKRIEITEVGPRDGWQNHKAMIIPTEVKAKYVKKMIDAGADKIEVTSFVNPKAVPQMANAKDLVALVQPYAKEKGCQTIGLALNKRGVDDAVAAGVDYVGFGISVSEEHNKRNSNRKKINFDVTTICRAGNLYPFTCRADTIRSWLSLTAESGSPTR